MSTRTAALKESLLTVEPAICVERAVLYTKAWQDSEGEPLVIRRALAFSKVLREMRLYIRPGALLVGNQASCPRAAPIFPEFAMRWLIDEMDELPKRPIDRFAVGDDAKAALRGLYRYWQGRTYQDRVIALTRHTLPADYAAAFDVRLSSLNQAIANLGRLSSGDGHIIASHERAMRKLLSLIHI